MAGYGMIRNLRCELDNQSRIWKKLKAFILDIHKAASGIAKCFIIAYRSSDLLEFFPCHLLQLSK